MPRHSSMSERVTLSSEQLKTAMEVLRTMHQKNKRLIRYFSKVENPTIIHFFVGVMGTDARISAYIGRYLMQESFVILHDRPQPRRENFQISQKGILEAETFFTKGEEPRNDEPPQERSVVRRPRGHQGPVTKALIEMEKQLEDPSRPKMIEIPAEIAERSHDQAVAIRDQRDAEKGAKFAALLELLVTLPGPLVFKVVEYGLMQLEDDLQTEVAKHIVAKNWHEVALTAGSLETLKESKTKFEVEFEKVTSCSTASSLA